MANLRFLRNSGLFGNGETYLNFYDVIDNIEELSQGVEGFADMLDEHRKKKGDTPFTAREKACIITGATTTLEQLANSFRVAREQVRF